PLLRDDPRLRHRARPRDPPAVPRGGHPLRPHGDRVDQRRRAAPDPEGLDHARRLPGLPPPEGAWHLLHHLAHRRAWWGGPLILPHRAAAAPTLRRRLPQCDVRDPACLDAVRARGPGPPDRRARSGPVGLPAPGPGPANAPALAALR